MAEHSLLVRRPGGRAVAEPFAQRVHSRRTRSRRARPGTEEALKTGSGAAIGSDEKSIYHLLKIRARYW